MPGRRLSVLRGRRSLRYVRGLGAAIVAVAALIAASNACPAHAAGHGAGGAAHTLTRRAGDADRTARG
ncbi:hypothetical protein ACIQU5_26665 [Streptomyces sp. NPDC090306]|uniref:hypothetical protein n=1 Tax=unclassified Streptomyces TaxID=2593676 RepID=UPI0036EA6E6D